MSIFKPPKMPQVQQPAQLPMAPIEIDEEKLKEAEKKKIKKGSTKGTIATGPLGLIDPANIQKKTLLGM